MYIWQILRFILSEISIFPQVMPSGNLNIFFGFNLHISYIYILNVHVSPTPSCKKCIVHILMKYILILFFFKFYSVNDLNYLTVLKNEIDKYLYILYPTVKSLVIVGVHERHLSFSFLQRQRPDPCLKYGSKGKTWKKNDTTLVNLSGFLILNNNSNNVISQMIVIIFLSSNG